MKIIYLLGKKEVNGNPFFDSVMKMSSFQFVNISLTDNLPERSILLIQWPEKIFNWKNPDNSEIERLKDKLLLWRRKSTILYLVHNLKPHYGMHGNFDILYKIIYKYSHVFIHFGKYSLANLSQTCPEKKHEYIPHPLYVEPFKFYPRSHARKMINLPTDALVIAVPGKVRHFKERELIFKMFDQFNMNTKKILLVPFMKYKDSSLEFKGRTALKKIIDVKKVHERILNKEYSNRIRLGFSKASFEELSLIMSASDVVIVPRIDILNSGNLFLGLSYKKIVIGPDVGNLSEFFETFGMPSFNPKNGKSIKKCIEVVEKLLEKNFQPNEKELERLKPCQITKKWDTLFEKYSFSL